MILLTLALGLLVLTGAVVVLFAMVGELAARLEDTVGGALRSFVKPLTGAPLDSEPKWWPDALKQFAGAHRSALFVFSTTCASCDRLAPLLHSALNDFPIDPVAVAIASPNLGMAEAFVTRHRLESIPHWLDDRGDWLRNIVGVSTSPACLVFDTGALAAALTFSDFGSLRKALGNTGFGDSNGRLNGGTETATRQPAGQPTRVT